MKSNLFCVVALLFALAGCNKGPDAIAAPATSVNLDAQKIANLMPKDLSAPWNDAKCQVAKAALEKSLVGNKKTFTMPVIASKPVRWNGGRIDYKLPSDILPVKVNGSNMFVQVDFVFDYAGNDIEGQPSPDLARLAKINTGDSVTLGGTVKGVSVFADPASIVLTVQEEASVKRQIKEDAAFAKMKADDEAKFAQMKVDRDALLAKMKADNDAEIAEIKRKGAADRAKIPGP